MIRARVIPGEHRPDGDRPRGSNAKVSEIAGRVRHQLKLSGGSRAAPKIVIAVERRAGVYFEQTFVSLRRRSK